MVWMGTAVPTKACPASRIRASPYTTTASSSAPAAAARRTISGPTPDASPIVIAIGERVMGGAPRNKSTIVDASPNPPGFATRCVSGANTHHATPGASVPPTRIGSSPKTAAVVSPPITTTVRAAALATTSRATSASDADTVDVASRSNDPEVSTACCPARSAAIAGTAPTARETRRAPAATRALTCASATGCRLPQTTSAGPDNVGATGPRRPGASAAAAAPIVAAVPAITTSRCDAHSRATRDRSASASASHTANCTSAASSQSLRCSGVTSTTEGAPRRAEVIRRPARSHGGSRILPCGAVSDRTSVDSDDAVAARPPRRGKRGDHQHRPAERPVSSDQLVRPVAAQARVDLVCGCRRSGSRP